MPRASWMILAHRRRRRPPARAGWAYAVLHHTDAVAPRVNSSRTVCYHFATQRGSTERYRKDRLSAAGQIAQRDTARTDLDQIIVGLISVGNGHLPTTLNAA